ncbi:uncharacterized protein [Macrobrachium rosenbergii]|uniref:uncharacterized protein isoform X3 n=1 Tax=Macrobrachium rosenbergii TaxID=79674 RepID=UPI0034D53514
MPSVLPNSRQMGQTLGQVMKGKGINSTKPPVKRTPLNFLTREIATLRQLFPQIAGAVPLMTSFPVLLRNLPSKFLLGETQLSKSTLGYLGKTRRGKRHRPGSASGQESSEVGSSSSGSAVEGSRGPSVVEGFLQASLNDNQHNCSRRVENGSDRSTEHYGGAQTMPPPPPPPPARENDVEGQEDIAGQGGQEDPQPEIINIFRRDDLEYGDQGMPPPLHENGNGVQDAVEQDDPDDQEQEIVYEFRHEAEIVFNRNLEHDWEVLELPQAGPEDLQGQGDLVEGPIPEIFNIPENEDGIFIEEDAPILLPENEFVHLPDRFNFQI